MARSPSRVGGVWWTQRAGRRTTEAVGFTTYAIVVVVVVVVAHPILIVLVREAYSFRSPTLSPFNIFCF